MAKSIRWQILVPERIDTDVKELLIELGEMPLREYIKDLVKADLKARERGIYAKKPKKPKT